MIPALYGNEKDLNIPLESKLLVNLSQDQRFHPSSKNLVQLPLRKLHTPAALSQSIFSY